MRKFNNVSFLDVSAKRECLEVTAAKRDTFKGQLCMKFYGDENTKFGQKLMDEKY